MRGWNPIGYNMPRFSRKHFHPISLTIFMSLSHTTNNVYCVYLMMAGWKDWQDIGFTFQVNIYKYFHTKFPKENFERTGAPLPGVELETVGVTINKSSRETVVTRADHSVGRLGLHPKEEVESWKTIFFMNWNSCCLKAVFETNTRLLTCVLQSEGK